MTDRKSLVDHRKSLVDHLEHESIRFRRLRRRRPEIANMVMDNVVNKLDSGLDAEQTRTQVMSDMQDIITAEKSVKGSIVTSIFIAVIVKVITELIVKWLKREEII